MDFWREVIPGALASSRVRPWIYRDYWADVGTIASFYDANIGLTQRGASFRFYDPDRPIYTRPRFLPAARFASCSVRDALVAEGAFLESCQVEESIVGIRTRIERGARISRSVLLGADFYEGSSSDPRLGTVTPGIGRDVVLDRVIVDKNARIGNGVRLTNEKKLDHADGDAWYIRDGIVIVPKGATVADGTVV